MKTIAVLILLSIILILLSSCTGGVTQPEPMCDMADSWFLHDNRAYVTDTKAAETCGECHGFTSLWLTTYVHIVGVE